MLKAENKKLGCTHKVERKRAKGDRNSTTVGHAVSYLSFEETLAGKPNTILGEVV